MNKTVLENAGDIPVRYEFDVIVAGGGPAGIGAALGAARAGAKTLVIEEKNCLGGIATSGMMSNWSGGTVSPVTRELLDRCKALKWEVEAEHEHQVINHELLKLVLFDVMEEAGVTVAKLVLPGLAEPQLRGAEQEERGDLAQRGREIEGRIGPGGREGRLGDPSGDEAGQTAGPDPDDAGLGLCDLHRRARRCVGAAGRAPHRHQGPQDSVGALHRLSFARSLRAAPRGERFGSHWGLHSVVPEPFSSLQR